MIANALLGILTSVLNTVYGFLPAWEWFAAYNASTYETAAYGSEMTFHAGGSSYNNNPISAMIHWMSTYNRFLPVYESLMLINAALLVGFAVLAWRGVVWIINVVRGSGAQA
jgi:hypothetical protein